MFDPLDPPSICIRKSRIGGVKKHEKKSKQPGFGFNKM